MEAEPGGLTYEFHKAGPPRPVANIATVGELRRSSRNVSQRSATHQSRPKWSSIGVACRLLVRQRIRARLLVPDRRKQLFCWHFCKPRRGWVTHGYRYRGILTYFRGIRNPSAGTASAGRSRRCSASSSHFRCFSARHSASDGGFGLARAVRKLSRHGSGGSRLPEAKHAAPGRICNALSALGRLLT